MEHGDSVMIGSILSISGLVGKIQMVKNKG